MTGLQEGPTVGACRFTGAGFGTMTGAEFGMMTGAQFCGWLNRQDVPKDPGFIVTGRGARAEYPL
ncbi:MAG: hypothetical protein IJK97_06630 [Thermoguttaceae bacterium]|nr:hypothetical protein [Thermoguttaceae bacterium]